MGLSTEENLHFKIDWASLIVTIFALFYFVFGAIFHIQAPKDLYLEGRFNKGFFLRYHFVGLSLDMEGLTFGILCTHWARSECQF